MRMNLPSSSLRHANTAGDAPAASPLANRQCYIIQLGWDL
jgi:hypothetical protein